MLDRLPDNFLQVLFCEQGLCCANRVSVELFSFLNRINDVSLLEGLINGDLRVVLHEVKIILDLSLIQKLHDFNVMKVLAHVESY